jgi:hypothetical protein
MLREVLAQQADRTVLDVNQRTADCRQMPDLFECALLAHQGGAEDANFEPFLSLDPFERQLRALRVGQFGAVNRRRIGIDDVPQRGESFAVAMVAGWQPPLLRRNRRGPGTP